jgi:hypothetical protein
MNVWQRLSYSLSIVSSLRKLFPLLCSHFWIWLSPVNLAIIFLLFICAYNVWVISPPSPLLQLFWTIRILFRKPWLKPLSGSVFPGFF